MPDHTDTTSPFPGTPPDPPDPADTATVPVAAAATTADCPECELCCALGLCCPPAAQTAALTTLFARETGAPAEECAKYAAALVAAQQRVRAHAAEKGHV